MSVSLNTNVTQVANTQPVKSSETKTDDKSKFLTPTQTKVAIGTGLAALATVGIYLATRGRSAKPAENVINDVTHNAQETANTIKEMTVDAFKQGGNKFVKGKALTNTGESFTGSITHQTKDGKNIVSEYENGLIKKSTKYDGENILSQKEYNYDENGKISEILMPNNNRVSMKHDPVTGKISSFQNDNENVDFFYSEEGNLKRIEFSVFEDTKACKKFIGKYHGKQPINSANIFVEFDPVTKKPIKGGQVGKPLIINYDKNGNPSNIIRFSKQGRTEDFDITDLKNDERFCFRSTF